MMLNVVCGSVREKGRELMNGQLFIARRENKMKQKDVAKKIGISMQSYHLKESGKREFNLSEAIKLSKLFDRSLDELFGG